LRCGTPEDTQRSLVFFDWAFMLSEESQETGTSAVFLLQTALVPDIIP
jgi:hypothetical protein